MILHHEDVKRYRRIQSLSHLIIFEQNTLRSRFSSRVAVSLRE